MITTKVVAPFIGAALALASADYVESKLPVVVGMRAERVSFEDGEYIAHVTGRKIRECIPVPGTFAGWYLDAGIWYETRIIFPDDLSPDSARPNMSSRQDFGLFQWSGVPDTADKVMVTVQHNCANSNGPAQLTRVGPFMVDDG